MRLITSAGSSFSTGATSQPETVPSSLTPMRITPPPEFAIAMMSLINSHHSDATDGSNSRLKLMTVDSDVALHGSCRSSAMLQGMGLAPSNVLGERRGVLFLPRPSQPKG